MFCVSCSDGAIYAFALGIASCCENTASPVQLAAQQAHSKLVKLFGETFYDMQRENLEVNAQFVFDLSRVMCVSPYFTRRNV